MGVRDERFAAAKRSFGKLRMTKDFSSLTPIS
jgi:hypothetical protein